MKAPSGKTESPAVVHGKSDQSQGEWFKSAADNWRRSSLACQPGKGTARRHRSISPKLFVENWDFIQWSPKIRRD